MEQKEMIALNDLRKALLSINGAFLRLGVNKDDVLIVLPVGDFMYFSNVLSSGVGTLYNFYIKVSEDEFTLSGLRVTKLATKS